jgi:cytochrome c biogenesis protein CcmG, thiol:disulfide interchange protein DsbE
MAHDRAARPSANAPPPYPCVVSDQRQLDRRERRTPVRLTAVSLAFVVATIAGAACTAGHANEGASSATLPTSPTALPAVSLHQFTQMLAGVRGTPVLLNVWASWCGPCKSEAPALASLAAQFGAKVRFVGLDVQDTTSNARAFVVKYHWPFPSVADPTGQVRNGLGFLGQPVTVVYDAGGKQVFGRSGPITVAELRQALAIVS